MGGVIVVVIALIVFLSSALGLVHVGPRTPDVGSSTVAVLMLSSYFEHLPIAVNCKP